MPPDPDPPAPPPHIPPKDGGAEPAEPMVPDPNSDGEAPNSDDNDSGSEPALVQWHQIMRSRKLRGHLVFVLI